MNFVYVIWQTVDVLIVRMRATEIFAINWIKEKITMPKIKLNYKQISKLIAEFCMSDTMDNETHQAVQRFIEITCLPPNIDVYTEDIIEDYIRDKLLVADLNNQKIKETVLLSEARILQRLAKKANPNFIQRVINLFQRRGSNEEKKSND